MHTSLHVKYTFDCMLVISIYHADAGLIQLCIYKYPYIFKYMYVYVCIRIAESGPYPHDI